MAFNISDFKNKGLTNGGARPSLFQVTLATPFAATSGALSKFTFTCRSSQIPAATVDSIPVPFFGRTIKLLGDRTYNDWPVTVMNDEDFLVRDMFENWSNLMNSFVGNQKLLAGNSYKSSDALVTQYGKDGSIIKNYSFVGIFPIQIDPMDLDWDTTNQIQSFGVTFAYDYWVPYATNGLVAPIATGEPGNGSVSSATP